MGWIRIGPSFPPQTIWFFFFFWLRNMVQNFFLYLLVKRKNIFLIWKKLNANFKKVLFFTAYKIFFLKLQIYDVRLTPHLMVHWSYYQPRWGPSPVQVPLPIIPIRPPAAINWPSSTSSIISYLLPSITLIAHCTLSLGSRHPPLLVTTNSS